MTARSFRSTTEAERSRGWSLSPMLRIRHSGCSNAFVASDVE